MIYLPRRALFIHIPRTSGISLAATVMRHCDTSQDYAPLICLSGYSCSIHRHITANELRTRIKDFAHPKLKKFAIIRNPWRLAESNYRYFVDFNSRVRQGKVDWIPADSPRTVFDRWASLPFDQFILQHFTYLNSGGFWNHWCCFGRAECGVKPVKYEELDNPQVWNKVCGWLRIGNGADVTRVRCNGVKEYIPTPWTNKTIRFIRDRCENDFKRFGYDKSPD